MCAVRGYYCLQIHETGWKLPKMPAPEKGVEQIPFPFKQYHKGTGHCNRAHTDISHTVPLKGESENKCKGFRGRWYFFNGTLWVHYLARSETFFFVARSDLHISLCNFKKVGQFSLKKYMCLPAVLNCSWYVWYPYTSATPSESCWALDCSASCGNYIFCSFNHTSWEKTVSFCLFLICCLLISLSSPSRAFEIWKTKVLHLFPLLFPSFSFPWLPDVALFSKLTRPTHLNLPRRRG